MLVAIDRQLLHLSVTPGSCLQENCNLIAERPVEPVLSDTVSGHPVRGQMSKSSYSPLVTPLLHVCHIVLVILALSIWYWINQ